MIAGVKAEEIEFHVFELLGSILRERFYSIVLVEAATFLAEEKRQARICRERFCPPFNKPAKLVRISSKTLIDQLPAQNPGKQNRWFLRIK